MRQADGSVFDASWAPPAQGEEARPHEAGERPVMRRETREPTGHRVKACGRAQQLRPLLCSCVQVDAALTSLDAKEHSDEDVQDFTSHPSNV